MKIVLSLLAVLLVLPGLVSAATHYVSPSGSASWADCQNLATPCSLATANQNAQAGDTVMLRGGTYSTPVDPANSGSSRSSRIVYQSYNSEDVIISGVNTGAVLVNDDYIKVKGINFHDFTYRSALITDSAYFWFEDCEFVFFGTDTTGLSYDVMLINGDSDFGTFVDCLWEIPNKTVNDDHFPISFEEGATAGQYPDHIIRKGCTFGRTVHGGDYYHSMPAWETNLPLYYMVVDSTVNNPVHTGLTTGSWNSFGRHFLFQKNRFMDMATDQWDGVDNCNHMNPYLYGSATVGLIARFNTFTDGGVAMSVRADAYQYRDNPEGGLNLWFYHNTIHDLQAYSRSGCPDTWGMWLYGERLRYGTDDESTWDETRIVNNVISELAGDNNDRAFRLYDWDGNDESVRDAVVASNLFYDSDGEMLGQWSTSGSTTPISDFEENWPDWHDNIINSDPLFVDGAARNLSLQPGSPAIDNASFLATVQDKSQDTITVDETGVYAFYDREDWGFGDPEYDGIVPESDIVYDDDGSSCRIEGIDYGIAQITLDSSCSSEIETGDQLTVVHYTGSAPDMGAFEYGSSSPPPAPFCGDGSCDPGECLNCTSDCIVPDCCGIDGCNSLIGENCSSCSLDCGSCPPEPSPNSTDYPIYRVSSPPVIDGDLSEFADGETITLNNSQGTSGTYTFMWDDTALYVAADVSDSQLNAIGTNRDDAMWGDDCIEMMFDTLNNGGSSFGPDDYKIFVNVLNVQSDSNDRDESWNMSFDSAVSSQGTPNQPGDTDTGYSLEISLPWSEWGIPVPSETDIFGCEFLLDDRDDSGSVLQVPWMNSDGGSVNSPDGWGNMTFSGLPPSYHPADTDESCTIETHELTNYIDLWHTDSTTNPMHTLMEAIAYFKSGSAC